MLTWHFVTAILILSFPLSHTEYITCSQPDCSCNSKNEDCNLQCPSLSNCKDKILTCNGGYPCDIDCTSDNVGDGESCKNTTINSNNATNLTVHCSEWNDCQYANINCNNAQFCNVICQSKHSNIASQICQGLILNCGTSQCSITCDDNTNSCADIQVDTSSAYSFQCIGSSISCSSAPNSVVPITSTLAPSMKPTMEPTTNAIKSTPSPILRIRHIIPSTTSNLTSVLDVSEIITLETLETINIYENNDNDSVLWWIKNNILLGVLMVGIVIFGICFCIMLYICVKQRYDFKKLAKDEYENKNIQIQKSDKKRYRHRIETQSHISYSVTPNISRMRTTFDNIIIDEKSLCMCINNNNANYNNQTPSVNYEHSQKRITPPYNNISSLISPLSNNNINNISPHLPLPITPINECKVQPVSPMNISQRIQDNNNHYNIILPPPPLDLELDNNNNEGVKKENITMIINEMFIVNKNYDEEKKNETSSDSLDTKEEDTYDSIMTDDGGSDNPNIKDDEFVINGDDEDETKGSEEKLIEKVNDDNDLELSIEIDDDMISLMSVSNKSDEGTIPKLRNKMLNFEMEPINENLCNDDVHQQNIDAISL